MITEKFSVIKDPRAHDNQKYSLAQLMFCIFIGVLGGCNNLEEIHNYLQCKKELIGEILSLKSTPSKYTLWMLLVMINPTEFEEAFLSWVNEIVRYCGGETIAIDGKALRGTCEKGKANSYLHIVHAWASQNQLLIGQTKTNEKSNEITAIPKLLKLLNISGNIVTIDAAGCQREIVKQIVEQGGNYILALKGNQGNLHSDVRLYFEGLSKHELSKLENHRDYDKGHGRIEERAAYIESDISWLTEAKRWVNLKSIIMIESKRVINGEESVEKRYYITNLTPKAAQALSLIRSHWGVESQLHWCLDVIFKEDECNAKQGHIAENLALFRRWVLNLLRRSGPEKMGLKNKRLRAGWDDSFLLELLHEGFCQDIFTK